MKVLLSLLLLLVSCVVFGEHIEVDSDSAVELSSLSAVDFLAEIRKPLRVDCWGEFTGSITHKGKAKRKGVLRVRMTFTENAMFTQVVLNDVNVYLMEQRHVDGKKAQMKIERPEKEQAPGLFDFGVATEDLTFAFIYWDFIEELPRESKRMNECRAMKLAAPDGSGTIIAYFHAKYGFPMEAQWFKKDEKEPWRKLELKGAKRHANGLWFVKEMRMEGKDWKTQVTFDHVELNAPQK